MIDHDQNVGTVLKAIDDGGITDNTFVMYSTDNGPNMFSWPDGAMTPFRNAQALRMRRIAIEVFESCKLTVGPSVRIRLPAPTSSSPQRTRVRKPRRSVEIAMHEGRDIRRLLPIPHWARGEIRADLRSLDPVEELAFVATECERLGAWTAQKGR